MRLFADVYFVLGFLLGAWSADAAEAG